MKKAIKEAKRGNEATPAHEDTLEKSKNVSGNHTPTTLAFRRKRVTNVPPEDLHTQSAIDSSDLSDDGVLEERFVVSAKDALSSDAPRRERVTRPSPLARKVHNVRDNLLREVSDDGVLEERFVVSAQDALSSDAPRRKRVTRPSSLATGRSTSFNASSDDDDSSLNEDSHKEIVVENPDIMLLNQADKLTSEALRQVRSGEVEQAVVSLSSAASLGYPNWNCIKMHLTQIENVKNTLQLIWVALVNTTDELQNATSSQERSNQRLTNLRTIDTKIRLIAMQLSPHHSIMKFETIEALKHTNDNKDISFATREFVYKPAQNEASRISFQPGGARESLEAIEFIKAIRRIHKKYKDVPNGEMILIARGRLHGSAVNWAAGRKANTLEEWVKDFTTAYVRSHEVHDYYKKFTTLKMLPSDDVQKFIEKFDEDTNILSSLNFLRPADEKVAAFQFAQGLPTRLREEMSKLLKIQFVQHASLQDQMEAAQKVWEEDSLVRAAVSEELSQTSTNRLNAIGTVKSIVTPRTQENRYGSIFATHEAVTMKYYLDLNSPGEHKRRVEAGLCFICSSDKHSARSCNDQRIRDLLNKMNEPQQQQQLYDQANSAGRPNSAEPISAERRTSKFKYGNKRRRLNHSSVAGVKEETKMATQADSYSDQGNE